MTHFGAVIMLGAGGDSPQEQMVYAAQQANTRDLVHLLRGQGVNRIVLSAPNTLWANDLELIRADDPPDDAFHFGQSLAALIGSHGFTNALYFGGGSTPLLDSSLMEMIVGILGQAGAPGASVPPRIALTNNLHSSDWVAIARAADSLPVIKAQWRDNSLAWALRESGGYEVRALANLRPATGFDIDTPSDLAILAHHPDLGENLRAVIDPVQLSSVPIEAILDILRAEAKTLGLIGRVSPQAWQAVNRVSRIWTRVIAEERGMVASERAARGEVRSILRPIIEAHGFEGFFSFLAELCDAALIDTRVILAAYGLEPSAADRYASDLLWHWAIDDLWLREFTFAAATAPIPVVLGGHSIVSGGLHALVEIISRAGG